MPLLTLLRPQQWIKNLFLFAAPVFGRKLAEPVAVTLAVAGFVLLCLTSSLVYVINDIHDVEEDRLHPRKRHRPLPAGTISLETAWRLAALLLVVGVGGSWLLDRGFGLVVTCYLLLQLLYTFSFKHAVILDVISIGLGFVLRAVAGAVLVHVQISPWLVLCTFTLCLFMGFSKRRCELNALNTGGAQAAGRHRRTLQIYTPDLLNHMTTLTAGIAVVSFMLYAIDARTVREFGEAGSRGLLYTLPIVVYCIFRFAVLVEHGRVDGPTDVVLKDRPFQIAVALWVVAALAIVYARPALEPWLAALWGG